MDIKNPEYIVEIARQQGVTRAAEKLFLTQSTLSQYLLKLEAELGTPLFRREQNRLLPTGAGRIYIQAAQDILRIQEAAREGIDALRGQSHIDLGVTSAWGLELLGVCDRILVMSGGRLAGEVDAKTTSQEEILTLAAKYV